MQDVKPIPILGGGRSESGPILQFQLKSTVNWALRRDHIIYDMEANAYNKLVNAEGRLLILYCLPDNIDEWVNATEEEIILRKCCYWAYVTGPFCSGSSKRIYIPKDQLFVPSCLKELLLKLKLGKISHGDND
jgi:hypothetical protein